MNNFLEIYDDAVDEEICEEFIRYYEYLKLSGSITFKPPKPKISREDECVNLIDFWFHVKIEPEEFLNKYYEITRKCVDKYIEKYNVLSYPQMLMKDVKIQKTPIGGGFHNWHFEANPVEYSNRILVTQLFLNTVDEGGETEFLYLNKRVSAKRGRIVVYPAAFTHTHRGNPPLSNEKYILTGWINFNG